MEVTGFDQWEWIMSDTKISKADQDRAQALRQQAADSRKRAYESFERSDTDGFMSQWASGITADELEMKAELIENGGVFEHDAVFDLDGNPLPCKEVETTWGYVWLILDERGHKRDFFGPSKAKNPETRRRNNARKGYYVGRAMIKGYVKIIASGTGMSGAASARPAVLPWRDETTGGYVVTEVIDNGQGS